jgi:hypothetical protein
MLSHHLILISFLLASQSVYSFGLNRLTLASMPTSMSKLRRDISASTDSSTRLSMADRDPPQYSRKQILREESEAPFRPLRIFIYTSLIAAALLGLFISSTGLMAVSSGAREGDVAELLQNIGINFAGIPILGYLIKQDLNAKDSRLERIKKGGQLAGLKVSVSGADNTRVIAKVCSTIYFYGIYYNLILISIILR